ncbi:MAG TPA: hypothetical protein VHY83_03290 [Solirubrobacteraceae bacterium]|nr:hypothetical protein [Solirubrobacteraceae bacterium]
MGVVVAAFLVFGSGASAGPPHGVCRHVSAEKCEEILGSYDAAQFLRRYVMNKLQPRLTAPSGGSLYCRAAARHRPRVFRCGDTVEGGGLPTPCTVEALVARPKPRVYRFDWLKESASCNA